jgi:hypothetical protein
MEVAAVHRRWDFGPVLLGCRVLFLFPNLAFDLLHEFRRHLHVVHRSGVLSDLLQQFFLGFGAHNAVAVETYITAMYDFHLLVLSPT